MKNLAILEETTMKKSLWSKVFSIGIVMAMILTMLPPTSLSVATDIINQAEPLIAIPDLDEVIMENSPELAGVVAFAQGEVPGYGSNGKFLAPIEPPEPDSIPISTREELEAIGTNSSSLNGKYHLVNDIYLGGAEWVPIGSNSEPFTGTFDGQGYVIKSLTIMSNIAGFFGLFGYTGSTAKIENVGLEGTYIMVSYLNPYVSYAGSICGISYASAIFNCYNTGSISFSSTHTSSSIYANYAGGICGYNNNRNSLISYCYNTGSISSTSSRYDNYAGGICGSSSVAPISYCYNTGSISATYTTSSSSPTYKNSAGGICADSSGAISYCYNIGSILSEAAYSNFKTIYYAGGICGSGGSISYCYNMGYVSSTYYAGGICGSGSAAPISYCYNMGYISSSCCSGGICGSGGSISNCYNMGDISSIIFGNSPETYAGGICGYGGSSISCCYNTGDIFSSSTKYNSNSYAGGICGHRIGNCVISSCVVLSNLVYAENPTRPAYSYSYLIGYGTTKTNNLALEDIEGNAIDDSNGRITPNQAREHTTYKYLDWEFGDVWQMASGYAYPQLRGMPLAGLTCLSNDANLADLSVSPGVLSPAFNTNTTGYSVSVANSVTGITITATARNQAAKVDGASTKDNLAVGANSFPITVTAEDGSITKTYTVTVNRAPPPSNDAKLKSLGISPDTIKEAFDPNKLDYTATVPYEASSVSISAEVRDTGARILSGTGIKTLPEGTNTFLFHVIVIAADNNTIETYEIAINRDPPPLSDDAKLESLNINTDDGIVQLDPSFDPENISYTASVPYEVSNVIISAVARHQKAAISGAGLRSLEVGSNPINIEVTAEDGITKETYTISLTRDPEPPNPPIIDIITSVGILTPSFDPDTPSYTISVEGDVSSVAITALAGGPDIRVGFSEGSAYQIGDQWISYPINLDTGEKEIAVYVYKEMDHIASYSITIIRDPSSTPAYKWEVTGDIGTIGRVLFDIPAGSNFLDMHTFVYDEDDFLNNFALVCDEDIDAEIFFSPKRTENAITAGQNTYIFAVRLPNGETREDISFSFKPIGGAIEKNKVIIYGDINEDGNVTTTDATLVTRWAGGNTAAVLRNILAADVNGDASITTTDATLITRRAGGNPAVFSIETRF
jgi:hypothetical protein